MLDMEIFKDQVYSYVRDHLSTLYAIYITWINRILQLILPNKPSMRLRNCLVMCEICYVTKDPSQMFKNGNTNCSCKFCTDCMSKHVSDTVNKRKLPITCPEPSCSAEIKAEHCHGILSKELLDRWESNIVESLISPAQRIYCPYPDCSALLLRNEPSLRCSLYKKTRCPHCKRAFCARCKMPWHHGSYCSRNSARRDDKKFMRLAKDRKWRKCPCCRFMVERISGCCHMTCRCGYNFCYKCGRPWGTCGFFCKVRQMVT